MDRALSTQKETNSQDMRRKEQPRYKGKEYSTYVRRRSQDMRWEGAVKFKERSSQDVRKERSRYRGKELWRCEEQEHLQGSHSMGK